MLKWVSLTIKMCAIDDASHAQNALLPCPNQNSNMQDRQSNRNLGPAAQESIERCHDEQRVHDDGIGSQGRTQKVQRCDLEQQDHTGDGLLHHLPVLTSPFLEA